jgi:hypothetical protein
MFKRILSMFSIRKGLQRQLQLLRMQKLREANFCWKKKAKGEKGKMQLPEDTVQQQVLRLSGSGWSVRGGLQLHKLRELMI